MKLKTRLLITILILVTISVVTATCITYLITSDNIGEEYADSVKSSAILGYDYLSQTYQGDWDVKDGKLYKGDICMSDNNEIIDKIMHETGYKITLFLGDTRVSTNVTNADGTRATGTKASDEIVETVLTNGQMYNGITTVVGQEVEACYLPLKNVNSEVIGMFFIGIGKITLSSSARSALLATCIGLVLFAVLLIVHTILYFNGVLKAINHNRMQLENMSNKDFTTLVPQKFINRKDEFGTVFKASAEMQHIIGDTIGELAESSEVMYKSINSTTEKIINLTDKINNVSSVTQELAAHFEETAASAEQINSYAFEVKEAVEDVTRKVKESEEKASQSEKISLKVRDNAKVSIDSTLKLIREKRELMLYAIEQSKSINEISKLSEVIMSIASKTNLLSLNASIEAARAGENGKSFKVVADQIKDLAESSKEAITEIQNVVLKVVGAVNNLAATSDEIIEFMDKKVTVDYKELEITGEDYYNSTLYFTNVLKEINEISEKLCGSMSEIANEISEVSNVTNENATAVYDITDNINVIHSHADEILVITQQNKKVSENLETMVSSFKTSR